MPCAGLSWGGLDVQILLELSFVFHRDIEGKDDRHTDPDLPAFEGIERRIGLLIQGQLLGTEGCGVGVGLVDVVLAHQDQLVRGCWLEPVAGRPSRVVVADLARNRALLRTKKKLTAANLTLSRPSCVRGASWASLTLSSLSDAGVASPSSVSRWSMALCPQASRFRREV